MPKTEVVTLQQAQEFWKLMNLTVRSDVLIPVSPDFWKKLFPVTQKAICYHVTNLQGFENLVKLQNSKAVISTATEPSIILINDGVETTGGLFVKLEGTPIISAKEDIDSRRDSTFRRWVFTEYIFGKGSPERAKIMDRLRYAKAYYADDPSPESLTYAVVWWIDEVERIMKESKDKIAKIVFNAVYRKNRRVRTDGKWDETILTHFRIVSVGILSGTTSELLSESTGASIPKAVEKQVARAASLKEITAIKMNDRDMAFRLPAKGRRLTEAKAIAKQYGFSDLKILPVDRTGVTYFGTYGVKEISTIGRKYEAKGYRSKFKTVDIPFDDKYIQTLTKFMKA